MTEQQLEALAREILQIVAHQVKDGSWWGNDTDCGSDEEIIGEAVKVLKRYLNLP